MFDEINSHLNTLVPDFIVFGGDLNTDMRSKSVVSDAVFSFARDNDLIEWFNVVSPSIDYTFHAVTSGHRSLIDWFMISSSLGPSLDAMDILDLEPNLSDHLPLVLELDFKIIDDVQVPPVASSENQHNTSSRLNWNKADLNAITICLGCRCNQS